MANELEWLGFASQMESGVREALDAAGIDCAMPGWSESEYGAASIPGYAANEQQNL